MSKTRRGRFHSSIELFLGLQRGTLRKNISSGNPVSLKLASSYTSLQENGGALSDPRSTLPGPAQGTPVLPGGLCKGDLC